MSATFMVLKELICLISILTHFLQIALRNQSNYMCSEVTVSNQSNVAFYLNKYGIKVYYDTLRIYVEYTDK